MKTENTAKNASVAGSAGGHRPRTTGIGNSTTIVLCVAAMAWVLAWLWGMERRTMAKQQVSTLGVTGPETNKSNNKATNNPTKGKPHRAAEQGPSTHPYGTHAK